MRKREILVREIFVYARESETQISNDYDAGASKFVPGKESEHLSNGINEQNRKDKVPPIYLEKRRPTKR
ncbi:hypothetical protein OnM2_035039 [Erysiphe neolycopersici]|uniref:Uncharacterized protein n=1 Tax=Erysiphe neolycopersici TaxID=212602 RepID=A0A420HXP1_9PEZI|nr:hypothetical protein OnM2_035039 [Erysiphe neolycopersici]